MARLLTRRHLGKHRVYDVTTSTQNFFARTGGGETWALVHNSHRLSPFALDALLKPMEDTRPGSGDKQLVCIFCTTEPEKMRPTIISRSLPFRIEVLSPEVIAPRLAWICQQEGFKYDPDALPLIAQMAESHIRDALKILEGAALLGHVGEKEVREYLQLGANDKLVDLLVALGSDLDQMMIIANDLVQLMAPTTLYKRLAEVCLVAFKVKLGIGKPPVHWSADEVARLIKAHDHGVLGIADALASRPMRTTSATFFCDLVKLHYASQAGGLAPGEFDLDSRRLAVGHMQAPTSLSVPETSQTLPPTGTVGKGDWEVVDGVSICEDARATPRREAPQQTVKILATGNRLVPGVFSQLLQARVAELGEDGQPGRTTLGSS